MGEAESLAGGVRHGVYARQDLLPARNYNLSINVKERYKNGYKVTEDKEGGKRKVEIKQMKK
jgi:hypothetical protein